MKEPKKILLTAKQAVFVEEYLSNGFNGTQAALSAGYSKNSARQVASDTLSKTYIAELIEQRKSELAISTQLTRDVMIQHTVDILISCKGGKDKHNALKAIEIINKMLGHNEAQKVDIRGIGAVVVQILKPEEDNDD